MRKTTIRNTVPVLMAMALLGLSLGGAPAAAGEGSAWQVAARGDSVEGAGVAVLDLKATAVAIDDVGNVLFTSSLDLEEPGRSGYFLGDGGRPRLVVHPGDALPPGAGVDAAGRVLEFVFDPFLSLSGRPGFVGSARLVSNEHVVIASDATRVLRTVVVAGQALPGVGVFGQGSHRVGLVHDDWAFMPGSIEDLGRLLIARRGTDAAVVIARSDLDVPLRDDVQFGTLTPRAAFADGSLVFTGGGGLFTWKPGLGVHTLAINKENAPGTSETYGTFGSLFSSVRIVDGPRNDFVEAVWAARVSNKDWTVYSTRENSGSAPIVRTGVQDGAYELVAGQQAPWGFEAIPGPLGQVVFIGATTGPDVGTGAGIGKGIGVWRHDPSAAQTPKLIAHAGMTFTNGGGTYTVERIRSVAVNSAGRVAMEVNSSPGGPSIGEALLLEDATGKFVCAIRSGDRVPVRENGTDLGTGRVIGIGRNGAQQFPDVTGTGLGGQPSRFNAAGQFVTNLAGTNLGDVVATGAYVFSLDANGGGGGAGGGGGGGEPVGPSVKVKFRRGVLRVGTAKMRGELDVRVEQGAVVVTGKNDTLVNGSAAPFRAAGAKKVITKLGKEGGSVDITGGEGVSTPPSIRIIGGPSDDVIDVSGATLKDIAINLGRDGADAVTIHNTTVTRNVTISAPRSETVYDLRGLEVLGRVHLRMGDLDPYGVTLEDCEIAGPLTLIGGRAGGEMAFNGSTCKKLTLNAGRAAAGSDTRVIIGDSSVGGSCTANAGKGAYFISVDSTKIDGSAKFGGSRAASFTIRAQIVEATGLFRVNAARAGAAIGTFYDCTFGNRFNVRTGRFADVVNFRGNTHRQPASVRTGGGDDQANLIQPGREGEFVDVAKRWFRLQMEGGADILGVSLERLLGGDRASHFERVRNGYDINPGPGENEAQIVIDAFEPLSDAEQKAVDLISVRFTIQSVIALAKR